MSSSKLSILQVFFVSAFLITPLAFGYIDPGAGHFILQSVIAAFFGSLFFLKRFISFFSKKKREVE